MRFVVLMLTAAAALASASARAADPAPPTPAEQQTASPAPVSADKPICQIQRRTGSHMAAQKVCMTRAEREAQQRGPALNQNPALTVNSSTAMPGKGN